MSPHKPKNVRIVTLGCAKNEVDSEEIAGVLAQDGWSVDGSRNAELTIINTCGFLESAKRESIEAIKKAVAEKGSGRVVVAGCLAQRMGEELARLAPGADSYVGVGQMARFGSIASDVFSRNEPVVDVKPPHHRWADVTTRARTGKPWSAYLKVSEGCDHRCTFCTIPSFRGPHASKPIERVLAEAKQLAHTGAKEINLIAQDVTQYGYDLYHEFTLPRLLRSLNEVDRVEWVRMLYFYPNRLTDEVIAAMAECNKVVQYVDIPLQHTHPDVLRRMKRPWDGDRYLALVERLRAAMPDVAVRTTFIVGFPGETEEEFETLLSFIERTRFERLGVFKYSQEEGSRAAKLEGQLPTKVKQRRYNRAMELQQRIAREISGAQVGRTLRAVVDQPKVARSHADAPDIDGRIILTRPAPVGKFVDVRITAAQVYDLVGEAL
jgi:ribosomal protein S12 methylthiotransferase